MNPADISRARAKIAALVPTDVEQADLVQRALDALGALAESDAAPVVVGQDVADLIAEHDAKRKKRAERLAKRVRR